MPYDADRPRRAISRPGAREYKCSGHGCYTNCFARIVEDGREERILAHQERVQAELKRLSGRDDANA